MIELFQAIFRSYRYGQTKSVFVYRLLASGSMEEKIYKKAVSHKHSKKYSRLIVGFLIGVLFR